jgi:3-carboxy-cis,cis-muconate cycloisomerase
MPGSAADSAIYGDLFGHPEMQNVFSDATLVRHWLRVEAALARAQAKSGVIPSAAGAAISATATSMDPDAGSLRAEVANVGYPIVPLIKALEKACGEEHGGWVHWGATTQDIMDTAAVLQLKAAAQILETQLLDLGDALATLVEVHRDTPMAGRTHGQHAVPTTFGYKAAVWLAEVMRHRGRLMTCAEEAFAAQLGGAAGTLASLGPVGEEVRRLFAAELGLRCAVIPWHTARDVVAEFALTVGLIAATLGKIAREVATLARTEIAELAEPHVQGKGASSTMPQKRNPILAETVVALSHLVTSEATLAYTWMRQENERGMGEWHLEWDVLPRTCIYTGAASTHTINMCRGLSVDEDRMLKNLELTRGSINAEAVMMRLGEQIGRGRAHNLIYKASMTAHDRGIPLASALLADPEVSSLLGEAELEKILDPSEYVGLVPDFCDGVLEEWTDQREQSQGAPDEGGEPRGCEHG